MLQLETGISFILQSNVTFSFILEMDGSFPLFWVVGGATVSLTSSIDSIFQGILHLHTNTLRRGIIEICLFGSRSHCCIVSFLKTMGAFGETRSKPGFDSCSSASFRSGSTQRLQLRIIKIRVDSEVRII